MKKWISLAMDTVGATTTEYAIIAALVAAVAIPAFKALGAAVSGTTNKVATQIQQP
jgi:Flp pilus assembly pilin Flp